MFSLPDVNECAINNGECEQMCKVVRGDDVFVAKGDFVLQSGDHVILFVVDKSRIRAVERLFQVGIGFF